MSETPRKRAIARPMHAAHCDLDPACHVAPAGDCLRADRPDLRTVLAFESGLEAGWQERQREVERVRGVLILAREHIPGAVRTRGLKPCGCGRGHHGYSQSCCRRCLDEAITAALAATTTEGGET